ncbi:PGF-CTERM sorting domain-containing protein [Halomicrobium sp. HM KBTZ05]|uniref:PGF-CTERM sorting domain-containing protein n=1 Tax=Halomicrobium sp. HM KBTZ05 TaxID=3242663 RepID=UPI003555D2BC
MSGTRSTLALLCVGLLVSAGAVGTAGGQSTEQETLTVTVVDRDDESLGGIDLTISWEAAGGGSINETTRANGQVLVDVPAGADVTITVHDDRYVRNEPFTVENATTEAVTVPATAAGTAAIEVVDADGPVDDAVVGLSRSGTTVMDTRTNDSGTATSQMIEQGTYTLIVRKDGYLRNRTRLTVDGDVTRRVEIKQASRLVTFAVVDDHFEEPRAVIDAQITVAGNTVTTLSDGEATIQLPVNSDYEVEVTKDGYETVSRSLTVRESTVRQNVSLQRIDSISVEPDQTQVVVGQSVRVTVTDEYGAAVENASIAVGDDTVGQTDENGEVTVPVNSAGETVIEATSGDLGATATVEGVDPNADAETTTAGDTATATEQTTTEPTSLTGPGFTGLGALLAGLVGIALLARRL